MTNRRPEQVMTTTKRRCVLLVVTRGAHGLIDLSTSALHITWKSSAKPKTTWYPFIRTVLSQAINQTAVNAIASDDRLTFSMLRMIILVHNEIILTSYNGNFFCIIGPL